MWVVTNVKQFVYAASGIARGCQVHPNWDLGWDFYDMWPALLITSWKLTASAKTGSHRVFSCGDMVTITCSRRIKAQLVNHNPLLVIKASHSTTEWHLTRNGSVTNYLRQFIPLVCALMRRMRTENSHFEVWGIIKSPAWNISWRSTHRFVEN